LIERGERRLGSSGDVSLFLLGHRIVAKLSVSH